MSTKSKQQYIAFCTKVQDIKYHTYGSGASIRVDIGRLDQKNGYPHPVNWSLDYEEPKTSVGGLWARIAAFDDGQVWFSSYGPEISYGHLPEYQHAARALAIVAKREASLDESRAPAIDTAERMGRWLEATGVKEVWFRPDSEKHTGWHNEGEWQTVTVGRFVSMVREHLPEQVDKREAALAAEATEQSGGAQ